MRRFTVSVVLAFAILVMLAPPGFAQAPAPKVTISGLFDQVTSMGRNTYDGNLTRNSDSEWYGRTRFRPDFEFAVGRVRAVLGLEIDLAYGQSGTNDGGFPGNTSGTAGGFAANTAAPGSPRAGATPPGCKVNTNGCLDINTDVGGMIEIKWVYTEFPLTGKDSLLPFIPVETMARQAVSRSIRLRTTSSRCSPTVTSPVSRRSPRSRRPSRRTSPTSSSRTSSPAPTGVSPSTKPGAGRTGRSSSAPSSRPPRGSTSSRCSTTSTPMARRRARSDETCSTLVPSAAS